ncbi:hypothetical protein C7E18_23030, partial [Stenotrophomonas maltophilia]
SLSPGLLGDLFDPRFTQPGRLSDLSDWRTPFVHGRRPRAFLANLRALMRERHLTLPRTSR